MSARLMITAAAALAVATSAIAKPARPQGHDSTPPTKAPAELVLASAEAQSPAPVADQQSPAPAKHRAARVTTCRCGDPQTQDQ